MSTTDLTQFKHHILLFLRQKSVDEPTIERVRQLMAPMPDEQLFLFCEFSFILKRRECDPIKKTGEHAIRDHLQTFWHDENRLVKDLRYSDYIHYFTKYNRCTELFDFFKLCTEHGNRKRPLSFAVKLQEFMATPMETLRSRSDRKSKGGVKKQPTIRRTTGMKRMKYEDLTTPCDLEYIPSTKKIRTMKHEQTFIDTPTIDLFATEFPTTTLDEQWSPVSHSSTEESYTYSSPSSSPHSPLDSPLPLYSEFDPSMSQQPYPIPSYTTNYTVPTPITSAAPPTWSRIPSSSEMCASNTSAAPPTWSRIPSLSSSEMCTSDPSVDWDAIANDLNKTYQPIVESYYQQTANLPYYPTSTQGWFATSSY